MAVPEHRAFAAMTAAIARSCLWEVVQAQQICQLRYQFTCNGGGLIILPCTCIADIAVNVVLPQLFIASATPTNTRDNACSNRHRHRRSHRCTSEESHAVETVSNTCYACHKDTTLSTLSNCIVVHAGSEALSPTMTSTDMDRNIT